MIEDLIFYRELSQEEKQKFREDCRKEIVVTNCSYCGQQKVVYTRIYEPSSGYGDHSHHYMMQFICGGKSNEKKILCDTCLSASARIDLLEKLEGKIEDAEEDLNEVKEKAKKLLDFLKEMKK